jgi:hypothetical protein
LYVHMTLPSTEAFLPTMRFVQANEATVSIMAAVLMRSFFISLSC